MFVSTIYPVVATTNKGTIQGSLSYPSDYVPSLMVCAQNTQNPNEKYCLQSKIEQRQYSVKVPPGLYYVFASDIGLEPDNLYHITGTYSQFVNCGLNYKCKNHTPIAVSVKAGQVVNNINPADFTGKLSKKC